MIERRYFADESPGDFERRRLGALRLMTDPVTTRRLERLGIGWGWRCLEVGAGDGGLARWMAGRVGPEGHVVATDIDPRFLDEHRRANLEVRRHDIARDDLEAGHYDLVHCRMVLQHLPDPARALERMADAVRPGGWLIVEESDWASLRAADPEHPRSSTFDRTARAIVAGVDQGRMMDAHLGRRLHGLVERLALAEVGNEGTTWVGRGGDPAARFIRLTGALVRAPLVAAGVLAEADLDDHLEAYEDPSFRFVVMTLFGAWGRR